jgi:hypothetical protein
LDLALLIHRQNHRLFRGMQVEAHHVGHLGRQLGILAEFEGAGAVGLEPVLAPNRPHRGRAHLADIGHLPAAPVGVPRRRRADGRTQHQLAEVRAVDRRTSPPRSILQPCQTNAQKPLPPEQDCGLGAPHLVANCRIRLSIGSEQDHPGPLHLPLRQGPAPGPEF